MRLTKEMPNLVKFEVEIATDDFMDIKEILHFTRPWLSRRECINRIINKHPNIITINCISTDSNLNSYHSNTRYGEIGMYGEIRINYLKD